MTDLYDDPILYDRLVLPGPCEAFYAGLAAQSRAPVLELCCGTGRLTLPLAAAHPDVTGLDCAPAMLAQARRKAAKRGSGARFVEGDMRDFDLGRLYGLIVVSCNSLAHLTDPSDLRRALANMRRHLAPGGLLAFDVSFLKPEDLRVADEPRRLDLGPNPSAALGVEAQTRYDPLTQVRSMDWRLCGSEGAPWRFDLRVFFPQEIPLLLERAGLRLSSFHGDFAANPLSSDSLMQIGRGGDGLTIALPPLFP